MNKRGTQSLIVRNWMFSVRYSIFIGHPEWEYQETLRNNITKDLQIFLSINIHEWSEVISQSKPLPGDCFVISIPRKWIKQTSPTPAHILLPAQFTPPTLGGELKT